MAPLQRQMNHTYRSGVLSYGETALWMEPGPHELKLKEKFAKGV